MQQQFIVSTPHWSHEKAAKNALRILQYGYPIFLLFFFIFAFAARSILTASPSNDNDDQPPRVQYGPGGKPLPIRANSYKKVVPRELSRPRKLVFEWLSVGVCLTYIANAAVVIFHALYDREQQWWCGQAPTVSRVPSELVFDVANSLRSLSWAHSSVTRSYSYRSSTLHRPQQVHISQHGPSL